MELLPSLLVFILQQSLLSHVVAQAGFNIAIFLPQPPTVLGLNACTTMPGSEYNFKNLFTYHVAILSVQFDNIKYIHHSDSLTEYF